MARRWLTAFRVLDSIGLVVLIGIQSAFINYFIIRHYNYETKYYFWFIGDGILILISIVALILSYNFILQKFHAKIDHIDIPHIQVPMYGVLPFGYITWFLYSSYLIAKVAIIFSSSIPDTLPHSELFSTITLKIALSASVLVFILLINTHHDAEPNSERNNYIADLCKGTAFDLFDSVSFLSFLLSADSNLKSFPDLYTNELRNAIIALSCINFLLPTLSLIKLSLSDFGELEQPIRLSLISKTCKLFFINFPYMVIRLYLWQTDDAVSVFLVKNVLYVLISLRYMVPEYIAACKNIKTRRNGLSSTVKPMELRSTA